jgi:CRISPR-associated protein Cas2
MQRQPPTKFLVLVAYDVSDNRRRTRLVKRLGRYAQRVQRSVFEAYLTDPLLDQMIRTLRDTIEPTDDVRIYRLCKTCREQEICLGAAEPFPIVETIII